MIETYKEKYLNSLTSKWLATLNEEVERGRRTIKALAAGCTTILELILETSRSGEFDDDPNRARATLQNVAMFAASLERHSQQAGRAPGEGIALVRPLEPLLFELGAIADHPPRDTAATYWFENRGPQGKRFTYNPLELMLRFVLQDWQRDAVYCARNLRLLARSAASGNSDFARTILNATIQRIDAVPRAIHHALATTRELERSYTAEDFLRLRSYLLDYPVAGKTWGAPDPSHLAAQMQLDVLLGALDPDFEQKFLAIAASREPYLLAKDRATLREDMRTKSIRGHVLDTLGFDIGGILDASENEIKTRMLRLGRPGACLLEGYLDLWQAARYVDSVRARLLDVFLKAPPAPTLSANALTNLVLCPDMHDAQPPADAVTERLLNAQRLVQNAVEGPAVAKHPRGARLPLDREPHGRERRRPC